MISTRTEQLIKIIFILFFSILGTFIYFYNGGTILNFCLMYLFFAIISRISSISYHRWLAHNYIKPNFIIRIFLYWTIVLSLLVKPIPYIAAHRAHHRFSDTEYDPHPPSNGLLNSFLGNFNQEGAKKIPIKDLLRNKELLFVNRHYYKLYFLSLIIFWIINPNLVFLSFLLLNFKMSILTTIFNYAAHGGRLVQNPINLSKSATLLLGLIGEEFHKNHHEDPSNPNFAKGNSIDLTFYILNKLKMIN